MGGEGRERLLENVVLFLFPLLFMGPRGSRVTLSKEFSMPSAAEAAFDSFDSPPVNHSDIVFGLREREERRG